MQMKNKMSLLAGRYLAALASHLKENSAASLQPALKLGRQAVAQQLETLELARIHEQALATLESSSPKDEMTKRAAIFFAEAITPVVETHRAARQGRIDLNRVTRSLNRRAMELAAANVQLKRGVTQRKKVEAALKKNGEHYNRLLSDSLQLQEDLRRVTHQLLATQEDERRKVSCELRNEVAQTLLGINVRLLSLKQEARTNSKGLKNEIASTQRLVVESTKSVRRVARGFNNS